MVVDGVLMLDEAQADSCCDVCTRTTWRRSTLKHDAACTGDLT